MPRPGVRGTFSQPGPSHPAAGVRLARTLGVSQTASVAHVAIHHASHAAMRGRKQRRGCTLRHPGTCLCAPAVRLPWLCCHLPLLRPGRQQSGGLIRAFCSQPPTPSRAGSARVRPTLAHQRRLTPRLTTGPTTAGRLALSLGLTERPTVVIASEPKSDAPRDMLLPSSSTVLLR